LAELSLLKGKYRLCPEGLFDTLFGIRILPISLFSSHFQVGLFRATSDNKFICKLYGVLQVAIIGGSGRL